MDFVITPETLQVIPFSTFLSEENVSDSKMSTAERALAHAQGGELPENSDNEKKLNHYIKWKTELETLRGQYENDPEILARTEEKIKQVSELIAGTEELVKKEQGQAEIKNAPSTLRDVDRNDLMRLRTEKLAVDKKIRLHPEDAAAKTESKRLRKEIVKLTAKIKEAGGGSETTTELPAADRKRYTDSEGMLTAYSYNDKVSMSVCDEVRRTKDPSFDRHFPAYPCYKVDDNSVSGFVFYDVKSERTFVVKKEKNDWVLVLGQKIVPDTRGEERAENTLSKSELVNNFTKQYDLWMECAVADMFSKDKLNVGSRRVLKTDLGVQQPPIWKMLLRIVGQIRVSPDLTKLPKASFKIVFDETGKPEINGWQTSNLEKEYQEWVDEYGKLFDQYDDDELKTVAQDELGILVNAEDDREAIMSKIYKQKKEEIRSGTHQARTGKGDVIKQNSPEAKDELSGSLSVGGYKEWIEKNIGGLSWAHKYMDREDVPPALAKTKISSALKNMGLNTEMYASNFTNGELLRVLNDVIQYNPYTSPMLGKYWREALANIGMQYNNLNQSGVDSIKKELNPTSLYDEGVYTQLNNASVSRSFRKQILSIINSMILSGEGLGMDKKEKAWDQTKNPFGSGIKAEQDYKGLFKQVKEQFEFSIPSFNEYINEELYTKAEPDLTATAYDVYTAAFDNAYKTKRTDNTGTPAARALAYESVLNKIKLQRGVYVTDSGKNINTVIFNAINNPGIHGYIVVSRVSETRFSGKLVFGASHISEAIPYFFNNIYVLKTIGASQDTSEIEAQLEPKPAPRAKETQPTQEVHDEMQQEEEVSIDRAKSEHLSGYIYYEKTGNKDPHSVSNKLCGKDGKVLKFVMKFDSISDAEAYAKEIESTYGEKSEPRKLSEELRIDMEKRLAIVEKLYHENQENGFYMKQEEVPKDEPLAKSIVAIGGTEDTKESFVHSINQAMVFKVVNKAAIKTTEKDFLLRGQNKAKAGNYSGLNDTMQAEMKKFGNDPKIAWQTSLLQYLKVCAEIINAEEPKLPDDVRGNLVGDWRKMAETTMSLADMKFEESKEPEISEDEISQLEKGLADDDAIRNSNKVDYTVTKTFLQMFVREIGAELINVAHHASNVMGATSSAGNSVNKMTDTEYVRGNTYADLWRNYMLAIDDMQDSGKVSKDRIAELRGELIQKAIATIENNGGNAGYLEDLDPSDKIEHDDYAPIEKLMSFVSDNQDAANKYKRILSNVFKKAAQESQE